MVALNYRIALGGVIMKAVILAGGLGSRIWPYNSCRNKTMIPIGNKPIVAHQVIALEKAGIEEIIVVGSHHMAEIKHYFRKNNIVKVIELQHSRGSGDTLKQVQDQLKDDFMVLFGDCFFTNETIQSFIESNKHILISPLHQDAKETISIDFTDYQTIKQFWGHPRGNNWEYFACGFKLNTTIFTYLKTGNHYFQTTKVGVGSPQELYLENALNDMLDDGVELTYSISKDQIINLDKPWHILEANRLHNQKVCQQLTETTIGNQSKISDKATINGNIILGENSYIGDNVVIHGNIIIGDNTIIDNGAIIEENVVIGNHCIIKDYCKIGAYSTIGDESIVNHTAEIIEAVLFSKVYLYHYGEYYGVIGKNTDLGAGTTCGTLRFDDGETTHYIKGKRQVPTNYSNASFLGDYVRTGVGAILLPGCKVGCKSIVGSGVILNEDVEDGTMIYYKQELIKTPWGDDKYGW